MPRPKVNAIMRQALDEELCHKVQDLMRLYYEAGLPARDVTHCVEETAVNWEPK